MKNKFLIGFYNRSIILTFMSVISAIFGIYFSISHNFNLALVCLMASGIFDMFDGPIARKLKRSKDAQNYGIQLDSLADMVSFIFLPIAISFSLGNNSLVKVFFCSLYAIAGVTRLAYFNTLSNQGKVGSYYGMPVTTVAIIMPLFYLITKKVEQLNFAQNYDYLILSSAILFVLNFKIKKIKLKYLLILIPVALFAVWEFLFNV